MSEMISSIQTIVFCSGAIIASAVLLWCLWKTFGFVGFPIGKMAMRVTKQCDPENPDSDNHRSALFAVILGGFICYGIGAYKTISHEGIPQYSMPGREMYDIGFWLAKLILSACGETVAVLAIISGVVKVLGLDGGKKAYVELGKDEDRMA
jgi:xanthine/uracil permease